MTFDKAVEVALGRSVDDVRSTYVDAWRKALEEKLGRVLKFVSWFPFIGRGCVQGDRALDHEKAESALRDALRDG